MAGFPHSTGGIGTDGFADAGTGGTIGTRGLANSTSGIGVQGLAAATTGSTIGVQGTTSSSTGIGVDGFNSSTTGPTATGTRGLSANPNGQGVLGEATATSGFTLGVHGVVHSPNATAGFFENLGPSLGGNLLLGRVLGTTNVFSVDTAGNVMAAAYKDLNGNPIVSPTGATFSGSSTTQIISATQTNGAGVAILGLNTSTTGTATGVQGTINTSTNFGSGVLGTTQAASGTTFGVQGAATLANPSAIGVQGLSANAGVRGFANDSGNISTPIGVAGFATNNPNGIGVSGSGSSVGVDGNGANWGVRGNASAGTGVTFGVADRRSGTGECRGRSGGTRSRQRHH